MAVHKIFILLNPMAGQSNVSELRQLLAATLEPAGIAYTIHETSPETLFPTVIAQAIATGHTLVVAAGGDGTVSATANALVGHQIPLAILPVGTANLLARELGIPLAPADACALLLHAEQRAQIDMMQAGETAYISHVSLGTYARIVQETDVAAKRRFGRLAYLWQAVVEFQKKRIWPFEITIDGYTQNVRASLLLCANIGGVGIGDLQWGADVSPRDGTINICIIEARTSLEYLAVLWYMIQRRPQRAPKTTFLSARDHIEIKTPHALPVRADGEIIGQSSIRLRVMPQAVEIVVPT